MHTDTDAHISTEVHRQTGMRTHRNRVTHAGTSTHRHTDATPHGNTPGQERDAIFGKNCQKSNLISLSYPLSFICSEQIVSSVCFCIVLVFIVGSLMCLAMGVHCDMPIRSFQLREREKVEGESRNGGEREGERQRECCGWRMGGGVVGINAAMVEGKIREPGWLCQTFWAFCLGTVPTHRKSEKEREERTERERESA